MVGAVVAACAVLAACVLAALAVRRSRRESERTLDLVFERLSSHLDAISTSVEQAVVRMVDAQRERLQPLSLDFDALVDALIAEAAARTGADAVVLRVEGPGGRPVLASLGAGTERELAERTFAPPDARPFRAATRASGQRSLPRWCRAPGFRERWWRTRPRRMRFGRSTRRRCTG